MSVELASDLWSELKRYVSSVDRDEAAETVVSLLIDHDYDTDDIRAAFKGDSYIKAAITQYVKDHEEFDDDDEDYDDYDEEDEEY